MADPSILESKTLDLDDSPFSLAYAAVVDKIKSNATLADVVTRFEASPYKFDPTAVQFLPLVIIECGVGPLNDRTFSANDEFLRVNFTCFVTNGNHVDLLNLDHAIRRAIPTRKNTSWMQTALGSEAMLAGMRWLQPAGQYQPVNETRVLTATSVLEIQLSVRECE